MTTKHKKAETKAVVASTTGAADRLVHDAIVLEEALLGSGSRDIPAAPSERSREPTTNLEGTETSRSRRRLAGRSAIRSRRESLAKRRERTALKLAEAGSLSTRLAEIWSGFCEIADAAVWQVIEYSTASHYEYVKLFGGRASAKFEAREVAGLFDARLMKDGLQVNYSELVDNLSQPILDVIIIDKLIDELYYTTSLIIRDRLVCDDDIREESIAEIEQWLDGPLPSPEARAAQLEEFAKRHKGTGVAEYAKLLFPEVFKDQSLGASDLASALPQSAPATWKADKQPGEIPPDFVRRVYAPWLGKGLTRANLRQLDGPLYRALYNWLSRGNEMPADVELPSLQEQNDRLFEGLSRDGDGRPASEILREARRIEGVIRYRTKGK